METGLLGPRPIRRFRLGLSGAILISLGFHLALLVWLHVSGPGGLLLASVRAASPSAANGRTSMKAAPQPLRFTFVDVPEDQPAAENPRARLLSDKTRVARQEMPTPPDAENLGPDPHAEGNSRLRQLARPGPPVPRVVSPPAPPAAAPPTPGSAGPGAAGPGAAREGTGDEEAGSDDRAGGLLIGAGGGAGEPSSERREAFKQALQRLKSGTYDFSGFDNPSYLQGSNYGTLSFDTKGYDWGDYARQLYLIIKKNWYDRIPIAAWYGQKGKVFIRFVIEKDGTISDLALIRSSDVPPLDLAAENAIRAANPLPRLPATFPKEREGVTFGFYYNLPIDEP